MATLTALSEVLDRFAAHLVGGAPRLERAARGLSEAEVWRIDAGKTFCLRGWPLEHPSPERLTWMHQVLSQAKSRGLTFIPVPLRDSKGQTFVELHSRRWEFTPWMPGEADYLAKPSVRR